MNKREARKQAENNFRSIGELRQMIASARGRGGMSRVNSCFTLEQVLDIYDKALKERDADEVPAGMVRDIYSKTGRMKPSRDSLKIANILRDCA